MSTQRARARAAFIVAVVTARTHISTSVDLPIWVQARRRINWNRKDWTTT